MPFDCPKCQRQTTTLTTTGEGLGCSLCFTVRPQNNIGILHNMKFSGKQATVKKMTIAEAMRIKTNKKRSDGRYRPDPRFRTTGD